MVISTDESDCQCTQYSGEKVVIQHEKHERLNVIPAKYEVLVELREKVACPKGCCGQIKVAPKPRHILPKSSLTEPTLAHIIVSKLDDRQPFYHLEQQFTQRAGVTLTRQTMARSMIQCCDPLQAIINLLKDTYLDYDIGALDATTLQVLNEPNRWAKTKSYTYCFRGGPPGKDVILYEYNALDHKRFVDQWFDGFKGTLHCDADPFFDALFSREGIIESNCHAHTRKKFEAIVKVAPGNNGLAKEAINRYKALYAVER